MDIVVCVKHVPDTAGATIEIDYDGRRIRNEELFFDMNDWDKYAVEEAAGLKEKYGGKVTAIGLGGEDIEETLRKCFVIGCDEGIRLTDKAFDGSDAITVARILHRTIKGIKFDLILTGAQAGDDGYGLLGPALAELLGIPLATLVVRIEIHDGKAKLHRELEGGIEQLIEIGLPAVLTIQTGINVPRYVSVRALMKMAPKKIKVIGLKELGMAEGEVGGVGSKTRIERLFLPPAAKEVEILPSDPGEAAARIIQILKYKGGPV